MSVNKVPHHRLLPIGSPSGTELGISKMISKISRNCKMPQRGNLLLLFICAPAAEAQAALAAVNWAAGRGEAAEQFFDTATRIDENWSDIRYIRRAPSHAIFILKNQDTNNQDTIQSFDCATFGASGMHHHNNHHYQLIMTLTVHIHQMVIILLFENGSGFKPKMDRLVTMDQSSRFEGSYKQ